MTTQRNARWYAVQLQQELFTRTVPLDDRRRNRYEREFNTEIARGIEHDMLLKVIKRISRRWDSHPLTVREALDDIERGKPVDDPEVAVANAGKSRMDGYERLCVLTRREERIIRMVQRVGKDTALAMMRNRMEAAE